MPEQNRGVDRLGSKKLSSRHNSVAAGLTDSGCERESGFGRAGWGGVPQIFRFNGVGRLHGV